MSPYLKKTVDDIGADILLYVGLIKKDEDSILQHTAAIDDLRLKRTVFDKKIAALVLAKRAVIGVRTSP